MPTEDPFAFCIHLWSTPRSLSTSLMYSFAQRADTQVLDEPLYAHYLRVTGAQRPYRDEVLSSQDPDGSRVVDNTIYAPQTDARIRLIKHMAKQCLPDLTPQLLSHGQHVLLIRDPLSILASFHKLLPPTLDETGFPQLVSIFSRLKALNGKPPIVVDARHLLLDPEGTVRALCQQLRIPFMEQMLSWAPGPRPEDGVWAPYWYTAVHNSTGFVPVSNPQMLKAPFPLELYSVLEECQPFYAMLQRHAIKPEPGSARPSTQSLMFPKPTPALPVPRNAQLLVWVDDGLVPRSQAKVHVLDSIAQGGDGVWEGLRIYRGKVFKLQEHLNRLFDSAKALAFQNVPSREQIQDALVATLAANGMVDNAHVRLTLTRGLKVTSGMSPHFNQYGCTLIVLAEWKPPVYDNANGIRLITASTRRNPPQCLDSKIHHNNLLNNILAKIEGNNAGADDAVMLDLDGFLSETNATNIFIVKASKLLTPFPHSCLPGITRATVLELAQSEGIPNEECNLSIAQLYSADEVFTTGTMGELTPCTEIDRRSVGTGSVGPVTQQLQAAYARLTEHQGWLLPEFPSA